MNEELIVCPHCGSSLCYTQHIGSDETWMCMGCGFTSTTLMKEGSETEQKVTEKQPLFYRDKLRFVDSKGYVWYPSVISVPEKGMVYVDLTEDKQDWRWASVPTRKLTNKERKMKKYRGMTVVTDTEKTQFFPKENFIDATISVGLFDED